ncbi:MAG: hypothetical protein WB791_02595 [Waddliaceae bacterium]
MDFEKEMNENYGDDNAVLATMGKLDWRLLNEEKIFNILNDKKLSANTVKIAEDLLSQRGLNEGNNREMIRGAAILLHTRLNELLRDHLLNDTLIKHLVKIQEWTDDLWAADQWIQRHAPRDGDLTVQTTLALSCHQLTPWANC